jgi:hypothetical protein
LAELGLDGSGIAASIRQLVDRDVGRAGRTGKASLGADEDRSTS